MRFLIGVAVGVVVAYAIQLANRELPEMGYLGWSGPHRKAPEPNEFGS